MALAPANHLTSPCPSTYLSFFYLAPHPCLQATCGQPIFRLCPVYQRLGLHTWMEIVSPPLNTHLRIFLPWSLSPQPHTFATLSPFITSFDSGRCSEYSAGLALAVSIHCLHLPSRETSPFLPTSHPPYIKHPNPPLIDRNTNCTCPHAARYLQRPTKPQSFLPVSSIEPTTSPTSSLADIASSPRPEASVSSFYHIALHASYLPRMQRDSPITPSL